MVRRCNLPVVHYGFRLHPTDGVRCGRRSAKCRSHGCGSKCMRTVRGDLLLPFLSSLILRSLLSHSSHPSHSNSPACLSFFAFCLLFCTFFFHAASPLSSIPRSLPRVGEELVLFQQSSAIPSSQRDLLFVSSRARTVSV